MRFELAGSLIHPDPLVLKFTTNQNFDPTKYIALGYTDFDVICIGGGGGMGGGINTGNTGTLVRSSGGAGGGGGLHRVQGLLSQLPISCPVIIGSGGIPGTDDVASPAFTTDGSDGGYSAFNNNTCRASGGRGGKRVQINSLTVATQANGGDGGVGNSITAGGGGLGGVPGTPTATGPGIPGTPGIDGTWHGGIGQGGGGGAGGVGKYGAPPVTCNAATAGGRGSYNPGDQSVYGPAGLPTTDDPSGAANVMPGFAGGGKTTPVDGLPYVYGSSAPRRIPSNPGAVTLRLTTQ